MKGFRCALRYGRLSIKSELRSVNLYLVLIVAFFWIQYNLSGLSGYLAENGGQMHVFEMYVHFLTTRRSQIVYLVGIMALACGSLFYSGGAAYYLIRGNRRRWAIGQAVYLLFVTAGYNLFLLFSFCCATGWHLTLTNKWSTASILMEQFGARLTGCRDVFDVYRRVTELSPLSAGLLTFLLSMLAGMAAGMIMVCFGLRNKGVFGAAVITVVWWADILIEDNPLFSKAKYLSLFGLSRLGKLLSVNGGPGIIYSVIFFCVLIAIAFIVLLESAEKIDFMKLE